MAIIRNQDEEAGEAAFEVGRFSQGGARSTSLAPGYHLSGFGRRISFGSRISSFGFWHAHPAGCRLGCAQAGRGTCTDYLCPGLGATLGADLELHFLRGPAGSALHERLAGAEFKNESFYAVSGLTLHPARAEKASECCVGDALTMIPPVTGNGMSMAFESAAWAAEPLAA